MALLHQMGVPLQVLMISDGSKSHPNSRQYPADKLRALRESETQAALSELGMSSEQVTFMRLPDGDVPSSSESPEYHKAVAQLTIELNQHQPQTILVPWRRDPHRDHRATYQLLDGALAGLNSQPTILEYPIWLWEIAESADAPVTGEVSAVRLNINSVKAEKQRAIYKHASQIDGIIDDDPECFQLSPHVLERFLTDWEIYLEEIR